MAPIASTNNCACPARTWHILSQVRDVTALVRLKRGRSRPKHAFTLVEMMIAMLLLATVLVGFLGSLIQSRRVTEGSVMHAAATSLVYGLIEQMKGLDYTSMLPSSTVDPDAPATSSPPYIRLRVNQDLTVWLRAVYTAAPGTPKAPASTPAADVTVASLGNAPTNIIGPLPLSTTTGARSQQLTLEMWLWVDEIPDSTRDVAEVKKITVVYRYYYNDGRTIRPVIDREVFIRTRYDT